MTHQTTTTMLDIPEAHHAIKEGPRPTLRLLVKEAVPDNPTPSPVPKKYDLSTFSHRKLIRWANYRVPMKVVEGIIVPFYSSETIYYVCPRCLASMEREYISFCGCCGQKLDWRGFRKAKLHRAGEASSLGRQSKKHV